MKCFLIVAIFCLSGTSSASPYASLKSALDSIEGSGRITHGSEAQPGQLPYQVGLLLGSGFSWSTWCGGSLISDTFVLTAAHCLEGMTYTQVHFGTTARSNPEKTQLVMRNNFIFHPDWSSVTFQNDIALIKIRRVNFSKTINKVVLPAKATDYETYVNVSAIASGWGRVSDKSSGASEKLQYANMKVVDNNVCYAIFGPPVTSSILCLSTEGGSSTCQGDSGGPLVIKESNTLIGLTSLGSSEGCELGLPELFTRVTSYLDWIEEVTGVSY